MTRPRRLLSAATLLPVLVLLANTSARAQALPEPQAAGTTSTSDWEFLPRYEFHMDAEHLSSADPRFVWDTNFGGEMDVLRHRRTRLSFIANYQAILGEQFRDFDPNQGNYILSGTLMTPLRGFEIGPVFYHQSRHLSDRPKRFPVDWNLLGGRVTRRFVRGAGVVDARVDLRAAVERTFVDYRWELDAGARARYPLSPHVAVVGGGFVRHLGVDGTRPRGGQTGARGDAGLRFQGTRGAMEFFVAAERRIDPYQLEFGTATWASFGMRLLGP